MAVTASTVRSRWSIPATIDDTLLAALITEATRKYRSATGEDGLSAYAAHLALQIVMANGGSGGRAVVSASHNAASKTLAASAFYTPESATEAGFMETFAGREYVKLYKQHPLSYLVTPRQ